MNPPQRTPQHTAIVTGGNRGIGLEACRGLAKAGYRVVLTARDEALGRETAASLSREVSSNKDQASILFAPLDLSDPASIDAFPDNLPGEDAPPVVLVNNAGVSLEGFNTQVVRQTLAVNLFGPWRLTDALLHRLAPNARVVMVSSGMGALSCLGTALQRRFKDPGLTREAITELLEEFAQGVEDGSYRRQGWPSLAYSVSKVALNALTRLFDREWTGTERSVIAVCPGWVRTSMGGGSAPRSPAQGADTIVWAAQGAPGVSSGRFYRDRRVIGW